MTGPADSIVLLMSPLFTSPLIAPLLAFLLALGNSPAWLHCGHCQVIEDVSAPEKCAASTCCGCSGRAVSKTAKQKVVDFTVANDASDSSHDSSDCIACRAALSAPPVVASVCEPPAAVIVCSDSVVPTDSLFVPRAVEVDRSRGPPVVALT